MRLPIRLRNFLTIMIIILLFPIVVFANATYKDIKVKLAAQNSPSLPSVGSYENFIKLLEKSEKIKPFYKLTFTTDERALKTAAADYSNTNVQVDGVDESDIVKTDGEYIYQVNNERLLIVKAYPAEEMQVVSQIKYDLGAFYPNDLYVYKNNLVVIGRKYVNIRKEGSPVEGGKIIKNVIRPIVITKPVTKVLVYDISNKKNIKIKRTIEVDGDYLTSRMINSKFYMITNKYLYDYRANQDIKPMYKDSVYRAGRENEIDFKDIKYFPGYVEPNYILLSSFDILKDDKADIQTYLGSGQNVYASLNNIYVAVSEYSYQNNNTIIYKFNIKDGVRYTNSAKIQGMLLNQFSMDEYDGYFRVATTSFSNVIGGDTSNNLYILDENMNLVGKLEGLAEGENIKSARFLKDKVYLVTYKNIDPLFVIDASNPKEPKVLGYLKIPGFSTYLHPYDENHIIGFGVNTKDVEITGYDGKPFTTTIESGLKLSLFDITDFENPKEQDTIIIGGRGSYSELLYNHKALLFSKEKNIFAFPVTIFETANLDKPFDYGKFSFQGVYIFGVDVEKGLNLKGKITHITKFGDDKYIGFDYNEAIHRMIYINDVIYTISDKYIKASDINTFEEINKIELK
ncbi:beta-propeller domain-containing protein [Caloramator sp. CAR-1]|uniref:beta-propeller domain-containing protein n=1 Tax=Caloramator sp. CAR-1 TaxID=3062777 RepID=UPI0026E19A29|nr:beta-propeller domain-containing protein [Caloramator sp. CAR-1]MDO6353916.1 beta-propeller domain-containing protein [Caloramator sp. CAR-1]